MADISAQAVSQSKNAEEATQSNSWLSKLWAIVQQPFSTDDDHALVGTKDIRTLVGRKQLWILVVGLDSAGKSSILKQLGLGDTTLVVKDGFLKIESLEYKNMKIDSFEVGGGDYFRPWKERTLAPAQLIVWVVDSTDRDLIVESREELWNIARPREEMQSVFLVMAIKQDLPGALTLAELTEKMGLAAFKQAWHLQSINGLTGEGIFEGFEWLIRAATEAGLTAAAYHNVRKRVLTSEQYRP